MKNNKYLIETGKGLQYVDRLNNSSYFIEESSKYIKGEITLDELDNIITTYYKSKNIVNDRSEETDKVAIRISKLLSDNSFSFTVGQFLSIHSYLFKGIIKNAGKLRTYNISKKEWILDNASVSYGDYRQLKETLEYDFNLEKSFNYRGLSTKEVIEHLSFFIGSLWQIHAFEEGNTKTTAVFVIKYLRSLGFDVTNDIFAKNSWYFRNALVRANYTNINKGIYADNSYLIAFLENLLMNKNNKLQNKDLHIKTVSDMNDSKENRVLKLIKDNPHIKIDDIAKNLNISIRTVKSLTSTLQESKQIKRINGKRYGYWEIL